MQALTKLIKKLTTEELSPEDISLVEKIKQPREKYINLDTGRQLVLTSARRKAYINHDWRICGEDQGHFQKILWALKTKKRLVAKGEIQPPHKRKAIPHAVRHHIWLRDYGNISEGVCVCCGLNKVIETTAEAGHIKAFSQGGADTPDNLRMICRSCNLDMGAENMDDYMREHNFPVLTY